MSWLLRWFKWLVVATGMELNTSSVSVEMWTTYQLTPIFTPSNPTNQKLYRTSSDTSIATVSDNWLITPISVWNVTITVVADYWWYTDTCSCEVYIIPITSFQLNKSTTTIIYWNTEQLTVAITPSNPTYPWVTWTSSDTSIATVDDTWLVTSVSEWNCTITCTSEDWIHSASCAVTVSFIHVTSITLNSNSIDLSTWWTYQLTATVNPSDATNPTITWSTDNPDVATVDDTWLVMCVWAWVCNITCTSEDWWKTATCHVSNLVIDFILVAWWWAWWRSRYRAGWWWWAWWLICCTNYKISTWSYSVTIWTWWTWSNTNILWACGTWWNSTFSTFTAYWWGWGWWMNTCSTWCAWAPWWSWWWAPWCNTTCAICCTWQWNSGWAWCLTRGWWWGWYKWVWCDAWTWWNYYGWAWWLWLCSDIDWEYKWYAAGWWWGWCTWISLSCWWWCWWNYRVAWYAATCYWSWWWWAWCTACSTCCLAWWNWYQWIFIVSYPCWRWYNISWWTKYLCWTKCINCFTSAWTLTIS